MGATPVWDVKVDARGLDRDQAKHHLLILRWRGLLKHPVKCDGESSDFVPTTSDHPYLSLHPGPGRLGQVETRSLKDGTSSGPDPVWGSHVSPGLRTDRRDVPWRCMWTKGSCPGVTVVGARSRFRRRSRGLPGGVSGTPRRSRSGVGDVSGEEETSVHHPHGRGVGWVNRVSRVSGPRPEWTHDSRRTRGGLLVFPQVH